MATLGSPLVDVGDIASVDGATEFIVNRFPIPPQAFGFLIDPELDLEFDLMPSTKLVFLFKGGALAPEGQYLEPTIGQIWPR